MEKFNIDEYGQNPPMCCNYIFKPKLMIYKIEDCNMYIP